MSLIYKFDDGYSCDIGKNVVRDPDGWIIADLAYVVNDMGLNLKEMSDTSVWGLCSPIVSAHKNGVRKGRQQMIKRIYEVFEIKEGN